MNNREFEYRTEEKIIEYLTEQGILHPRKLEDGSWCGIYKLMFTWSVCMDIGLFTQFAYRWCFEDKEEAMYFLGNAKDFDEVPVRKSSLRGHRYRGRPLLIEFDDFGKPKW